MLRELRLARRLGVGGASVVPADTFPVALRRLGDEGAPRTLRSEVVLSEAPPAGPWTIPVVAEAGPRFTFRLTAYDYSTVGLVGDTPSSGLRNRLLSVAGREQVRLLAIAGDGARQRAGSRAAVGIEFAQVGDGLLDDLTSGADRSDGTRVGVDLAVLPARRITQVEVNEVGRHYIMISASGSRHQRKIRTARWGERAVRLLQLRKLN